MSLVSTEARLHLHSTAQLYEKALAQPSAIELTGHSVTITIKDPIVRSLEDGYKSFDIKAYMLKYGRVGKDGTLYVDVPFTHKSSDVPQAIKHKLTKVDRVSFYGKARKSSIKRKLSGVMKQSGSYITIRRISTRSPPSSWIHPGFKGIKLFDKLASKIKAEAINGVTAELNASGLKAKKSL